MSSVNIVCSTVKVLIERHKLKVYKNNAICDSIMLETKEIEKYMKWASTHKSIIISKNEIPIGILPNGHQGEIHDLKIKTFRGKPDDVFYDEDEQLRKKLARGNSVIHIIDGPQAGFYLGIFALRKFTSKEAFDDDDRQDIISNYNSSDSWKLYFTKPMDEAKSVICTEKMNGESAHLACLYLENTHVIVAGSKNVHMAFTKREHIDRYQADKYRLARQFAHSIMEMLDNLSADNRSGLLEFLAITRFTAVFEILCPDHQHIENISHFTGNHLKFITWTLNDVESTDLTSLPPNVSIDIAREFGLDAINYTKLSLDEIKERVQQVRLSYGTEGEVHYYVDEDEKTIGLAKVKTIWYILCRAIREKAKMALSVKIRNPSKYSHQSTKSKLEKRFSDIQSWLKLSNEVYNQWLDLSVDFIAFIVNEEKFSPDELMNLFPLVWKTFLDQNNRSDQFTYDLS